MLYAGVVVVIEWLAVYLIKKMSVEVKTNLQEVVRVCVYVCFPRFLFGSTSRRTDFKTKKILKLVRIYAQEEEKS